MKLKFEVTAINSQEGGLVAITLKNMDFPSKNPIETVSFDVSGMVQTMMLAQRKMVFGDEQQSRLVISKEDFESINLNVGSVVELQIVSKRGEEL